jgi:hypothetical protein
MHHDAPMRTTLTLDDDLAMLLKRRARELDLPFKEIVNTALRRGLSGAEPTRPAPKVTVRPHDFGAMRPGTDPGRLIQLVDELEAEEFLAARLHDPA